jgi:hypothetical protein
MRSWTCFITSSGQRTTHHAGPQTRQIEFRKTLHQPQDAHGRHAVQPVQRSASIVSNTASGSNVSQGNTRHAPWVAQPSTASTQPKQ